MSNDNLELDCFRSNGIIIFRSNGVIHCSKIIRHKNLGRSSTECLDIKIHEMLHELYREFKKASDAATISDPAKGPKVEISIEIKVGINDI